MHGCQKQKNCKMTSTISDIKMKQIQICNCQGCVLISNRKCDSEIRSCIGKVNDALTTAEQIITKYNKLVKKQKNS